MKIADIQATPIHPERWGNDLDVANAARVSFHKESKLEFSEYEQEGWDECYYDGGIREGERYWTRIASSDVKLINYLAKHKHFSPFNHSFLSFRIKAPIFVARQLVKHKFMPWNEVSRRYVDEEPEFYFPINWRGKSLNVKQGSSDIPVDISHFIYSPEGNTANSLAMYNDLLKANVAPEQARMVLPQNMMTEWIWSGTLGAFLDMLVLRLDPHTQKESRDVAQLIAKEVSKVFPISYNARVINETSSS